VLLPGIETVPVTMGAGLTPGEAISVDPKGMPVGETAEPIVMPSGDVAPMLGVGLTIALTCALAALQTTSAGRTAAINAALTRSLRFALHSSGAWLSDIGLNSVVWRESFEDQQRQMLKLLSSALFNFFCLASNLESLLCSARFAAECGRKSSARG
jgi:hypothetical protein